MKNIFLTKIFLFYAFHAFSCQCGSLISVKRAFKQSTIAISVTVIEILNPIDKIDTLITAKADTLVRYPVHGYAKKVVVNKVYKGNISSETIIVQGENSTCELHLELGKTYILYGQIENAQIKTNTCTRSGRFINHPDLHFLERKLKRKRAKIN